ncbi:MAG: hypothetical protein R3C19_24200 [Planctomycetaceae bacterium]
MPSFAATDSQDRLYVADSGGNQVICLNAITELHSGAQFPERIIGSPELIAPNRLLLFER